MLLTREEEILKDNITYIKQTRVEIDEDGNETIIGTITFPQVEDGVENEKCIEILSKSKQAAITAAINTEYLICLQEGSLI